MRGNLETIVGAMFAGKTSELLKRILWAKHQNKKIIVKGSLNRIRDFIYIDDVVNIIEQLTSTQFEELQNYAGSIPKVSQDANYVCKQCGAENNTKLEGLSDFF